MGTLLGPKYIPYTHMDPLGKSPVAGLCGLRFNLSVMMIQSC